MQDIGVSPLTWTYVKLLGQQLRDVVRDLDGLPHSHAWRRRLVTKAQCVGVLVSIHERAERVELLVDDGTALVRAVWWSPTWRDQIALGDLVRVEGKLNMDSSWANDTQAGAQSARELRVVQIQKISDPNEELLHWLDAIDLTTTVYESNTSSSVVSDEATILERPNARPQTPWDCIATRAFHDLEVDEAEVVAFLNRSDTTPHDHVLVDTLRDLIARQRRLADGNGDVSMKEDSAMRFTFPDLLQETLRKEHVALVDALHHVTTRSLRHVFAVLRSSGLVFLEDTNADRYVFLSDPFSLTPFLLEFLQKEPIGASIAEIAERVLTLERFKRISIDSLKRSVERLVELGRLDHPAESQRYFYCRTAPLAS